MNTECAKCKADITNKPSGGIGSTWFCEPCYKDASKVRLDRMRRDLASRNIVSEKWRQIRSANDELAEIRKNQTAIREGCLIEAQAIVMDRIKRLTFFARIKLLFSRQPNF